MVQKAGSAFTKRRQLFLGKIFSGRGDELVHLQFDPVENFVVGKLADQLCPALQVDEIGGAPEPQIGVVGLSRSVDPAAHDGDGDGVFAGIGSHCAHIVGKVYKGFVFDSGAGGAGNDIESLVGKVGN